MTRQMIDSAFPLRSAPPGGWRDIVLIYAGGDTPHPWTTAEILAMPARYRLPTWVRSNPQQVSAALDVALFTAWLHGHHVPMGTCVCLDYETAVDTGYVNTFNLGLRAAGYRLTKYGSQSTIWQNPKTDGGTFVALPGHPDELTTEGDTVATQYAFDGAYDLSITKDQAGFPLWDAHPPAPPAAGPFPQTADGTKSLHEVAAERRTTPYHLAWLTMGQKPDEDAMIAYLVAEGGAYSLMPKGLRYFTTFR
jgi:hypothetical protein